MTPNEFFDKFGHLAEAPNGVQKLRELILQFAVRGKLVPQDRTDEPAAKLLDRIRTEKARLVKEKKIRGCKTVPPVSEDEKPYEIPGSWLWTRLVEVFDVRDGTHDTPKYVSQGYPLVTSKNIYSGQLDLLNVQYISESDHRKISERSRVECLDILFAMIGSIGNPVVVETDIEFSIKNVALFKYYDVSLSCPYYLRYFLVVAAGKMREEAAGGVQSFVSLNYLRSFAVPLPPLAEQLRIVEKVDQLLALCDELEARQQKSQKKLLRLNNAALDRLTSASSADEFTAACHLVRDSFHLLYATPETIGKLRQAILQLAVQGRLVPQDPADEPAAKLLERIRAEKARLVKEKKIRKADPLPPVTPEEAPYELPLGWEWVRFAEVANIASNLVKPQSYLDSPHVAPDNIEKSTGKLLPCRSVREDGVISANHLFSSGQILYSKIRPNLSKVTIVNFDGLCSADMYPIDAHISSRYLLCYMLSATFLDMAVKKDTRVAMPKINQEELNRILVPVSPLPEQNRIADKVARLMALCDDLEAKLLRSGAKAERMTVAVVQGVLTG